MSNTVIRFTKMHGLGNDFVVINNLARDILLSPEQLKKIADRRTGIGCDQILVIEPSEEKDIDFTYKIYNQDGSESGQCGNGARCLAKFIYDEKLSQKKKLNLKTVSTVLETYVMNQDSSLVKVNMGIPHNTRPYAAKNKSGYYVDMGNPHAVFSVESICNPELDNLGLDNINIGYMEIINSSHIKLRVFERGAGETLACGSGACAAVAAGILQNKLGHQVVVELKLGCLEITWKGAGHPIWMTGPAQTSFQGSIVF